ncbi:hypothetical protein DL767_008680 [Monosporascus sp. MG133]|nr:hypothetical protein DL767_008680 [Monosporascus sp. MG133]
MADPNIIKQHPIGKGIDTFRASFDQVCKNRKISCTPRAMDQFAHEASRLLRSKTSRKPIFNNLSSLNSAIISNAFDLNRIKPLLYAALAENLNDTYIWNQVYSTVSESTPPPRPIASSLQQTPWLHNTNSFANFSEYRQDVDKILRSELGPLYIGLPRFREVFFGRVTGLETASEAVFKKYSEKSNPLFKEGWRGWPNNANQDDVLSWFADLNDKLAGLAKDCPSTPTYRRRPLT